MMLKIFLIVLAALILISLAGYAIHLILKLRIQKGREKALLEEAKQAQKERYLRILESIDVIAKAMMSEQCDLSEGVLRLKPLLDVLGRKLSQYTAMWALYQVVENMPILDERKKLKRNERMKLDLEREAKEVELESDIKIECYQLLQDIEEMKKAI
ncbi:coproporphyrinogen III oxidase [Mannheimia granulomatis]|nr:coproporphyrinogen III oxidase [Mannheimia granulomatis]